MGFETVFFAIVALVVLGRLFQVLGQNHGAPPPFIKDIGSENGFDLNGAVNRKGNVLNDGEQDGEVGSIAFDVFPKPILEERFSKFSDAISQIQTIEKDFNILFFEKASAGAFELIVTSFGKGDADTLKDLTTAKVFDAYKTGMEQRKSEGKSAIDIIKLNEPKIANIEIIENSGRKIAQIDVEFKATLSSQGEKTRNTNEIWTFERQLGDKNPIWRLSAVHSA